MKKLCAVLHLSKSWYIQHDYLQWGIFEHSWRFLQNHDTSFQLHRRVCIYIKSHWFHAVMIYPWRFPSIMFPSWLRGKEGSISHILNCVCWNVIHLKEHDERCNWILATVSWILLVVAYKLSYTVFASVKAISLFWSGCLLLLYYPCAIQRNSVFSSDMKRKYCIVSFPLILRNYVCIYLFYYISCSLSEDRWKLLHSLVWYTLPFVDSVNYCKWELT